MRGGLRQTMLGLNGTPRYLGTIDATTTGKSNGTATTPFTIPAGVPVLLVADASVFQIPTLTNDGKLTAAGSAQATTAMHQLDVAPAGWIEFMSEDLPFVWCRTSSGTANVKVFELR